MTALSALHLAAFGKHPGWDDHLDDQGMESPWLVALKRKLYFEGVGSNLDANTWEKLPSDQRLPGFDHEFLWRAQGSLALGRLSPSRDGKGRDRYPFVLCAEATGIPLAWLLLRARPQLAELDGRCRSLTEASDVVRELDLIRGRLRRTVELARTEGDDYASLLRESAAFPERLRDPALGAGQVGLHRILYKLTREAAGWLRDAGPGDVAPEVLHARLPSLGDPGSALLFWHGILLRLFQSSTPWILLRPQAGGWVDLLVGTPSASSFTCLCTNLLASPLASEVPYQIDPSARQAIDKHLSRLTANGGAMRAALADTGAAAGALGEPPAGRKRGLVANITRGGS